MFQKEQIVFQGLHSLPPLWRGFFKLSVPGNTYTVLTDNGRIVMCNTEFEYKTNEPLFDAVNSFPENQEIDVLLLGWGIAFVIPYITKPNVNIFVIEKEQAVLDLTPPDPAITIYNGDINTFDFANFGSQKFDVVWSDVTDFNSRQSQFRSIVKPGGKFAIWKPFFRE